MVNTFYKTSFRFSANRYEEWQAGRCISKGAISTRISAEVRDSTIHFELDDIADINMLKSFEFDIYDEHFNVLSDRIQYSHPNYDCNPMTPVVCHLFIKGSTIDYVRFAMTNPDRIVEFYGSLIQTEQLYLEKQTGQTSSSNSIMSPSFQTKSQSTNSSDEQEIKRLCLIADSFIGALKMGNEHNANLLSWNYYQIIHEKPYMLTLFSPQHYNLISRITSILIANPRINQSDSRILECANYAFYCLNRALEYEDREVFHQMRISLMADTHKWFYKTVADALGISSKSFDFFSPLNMPLIVRTNRDYYYMGYYDFEMSVNKNYEGNMLEFQRLVYDNNNNTLDKGRANIAKTAKYIENYLLASHKEV